MTQMLTNVSQEKRPVTLTLCVPIQLDCTCVDVKEDMREMEGRVEVSFKGT